MRPPRLDPERHRLRLFIRLVATAVLLAWVPGSWSNPAELVGQAARLTIVDEEVGDPVSGALIRIKGRPDALTDERGQVEITGLEPGRIKIEIRAIGFEPREEYVLITPGKTVERRIGLSFTGYQLPELVVEARREKLAGRYQDFHRRQAAGNGHFITWEEIKGRGHMRLGDALRGVRGVWVLCRTHECVVSMSRSTGCPPTVWVDGSASAYFGVNMPIGDVYGIEVYRGSGEIPAEYAGTSGCGAIVIWTKNRPYR